MPVKIAPPPGELLTPAKAAQRLTVSRRTLDRLKDDRKLPFYPVGSGTKNQTVRYWTRDLDAYLRGSRVEVA